MYVKLAPITRLFFHVFLHVAFHLLVITPAFSLSLPFFSHFSLSILQVTDKQSKKRRLKRFLKMARKLKPAQERAKETGTLPTFRIEQETV